MLIISEQSPFIAEQIAIDCSSALRSAEVGLRALRERPLMRRLWDGIIGYGNQLQSAIGSDLATVQKATISLIQEVMTEELRTQDCMERVLYNLHDVNADLDAVITKVNQLKTEMKSYDQRQRLLEIRIHYQTLFTAGRLHPGTGDLIGASLYLAQMKRLFANIQENFAIEALNDAKVQVQYQLGNRPETIHHLFLQAVDQIQPETLEVVAYLVAQHLRPALYVLNTLIEPRMLGFSNDLEFAKKTLIITRKLRDPDGELKQHLLRPWELAEKISSELLTITL